MFLKEYYFIGTKLILIINVFQNTILNDCKVFEKITYLFDSMYLRRTVSACLCTYRSTINYNINSSS